MNTRINHLVSAILCLTIAQVGITFYLPAMTTYAVRMSTDPAAISSSVAVYLLFYGFAQLIAGPVSEKVGRSAVLLCGLLVFFTAAALLLVVDHYRTFIAVRAMQGIGGGMLSVLVKLILRDAFAGPELTAAFSILEASSSVTPAVAPFLGGLLVSRWGWKGNFIAVCLWSFCAGCGSTWLYRRFSINKTKIDITILGTVKAYLSIVRNPYFLAGGAIILIVYSTVLVFLSYSPLLFQRDLLLSADQYGRLMVLPAVSTALSGYAGTRLSKRMHPSAQIRIGAVVLLASGILSLIVSQFPVRTGLIAIAPFIVGAFSAALILPCAYSLSFQLIGASAGYVAALFGCLQLSGSSLFRILIGSTFDSPRMIGLYYLLVAVLTFMLSFIYRSSERPNSG